jgi:hypothetical protein
MAAHRTAAVRKKDRRASDRDVVIVIVLWFVGVALAELNTAPAGIW